MLRYVKSSWKLHGTFEKSIYAAWEEATGPKFGVPILILTFPFTFLKNCFWVCWKWCLFILGQLVLKTGLDSYLLLQASLGDLKHFRCHIL